jgi:sugar diacid utilization regulator/putative methionine-R-sulfoxide reductase with GAF domain
VGLEVAGDGAGAARRSGRRARLPGVRHVYDDKAYLFQIIETIGSGPDLTTILRGVVRLVTEATQCHACFVYFQDDRELVLRAASSMYVPLEGTVRLPVGEGLTGWVAKHRRSAFIKENALEDPRVRYFPELEDEQFQSLVSVPIFARAGDVIGVITLHAVAPHEFGRGDLDFLEHTAALVAGAIENAQLYEEATRQVGLLTQLSHLAQRIASSVGAEDLLPMVAAGCRELIDAERCEIYLLDADGRLCLRSASPGRSQAPSLEAVQIWFDAADARVEPEPRELGIVASVMWGEGLAGTPMLVPLEVGEERLGLLCALVARPQEGAASALAAVASHAAVALKQHQVIDWLRERNLTKDFFEGLSRGDAAGDDLDAQAARLGVRLEQPHVLLHAVPWTSRPNGRRGSPGRRRPAANASWTALAARLETRLVGALPDALFDRREHSMRGLLSVPPEGTATLADTVRRIYDEVAAPDGHVLAVGLSDPCRGIASFGAGFEEARVAAEIGALIGGGAGVFTYEGLGPYRYTLLSEDSVRDRYHDNLARLIDYERRRGTELLDTLEAYLDNRGNAVRTSRQLYIHANTLRQRLQRIERVAGIDLEREDWLSLAIAVKVVKLRRMKQAVDKGGREDG